MASRLTLESIFKAKDRLSAPITKMQNRVGKFTRSMRRGIGKANRAIDKMTKKLRVMPLVGTAGLVGLGFAMKNVIETGSQFEKTLVAAAVKFNPEIKRGTDAFKELEKAARDAGRTTEFTSQAAAEGLNFLAFAGFDAEQAIAALPGVIDLATAAELDLGRATDIATDTLGAFGLATKDPIQQVKNLNRVNDRLVAVTTSANTNMEDLFDTIKDSAPIAKTAGASMEELVSFAGLMANAGIKGTKAATTMKNAYINLAAPSKKQVAILDKLNVKIEDGNGDMKTMTQIVGELAPGLLKMGTRARTAAVATIFGKRAVAGMNIVLDQGEKKILKYTNAIKDSDERSKKMAKTMRLTTAGAIAELNSSIESIKLTFFSAMQVPLEATIKRLTGFARKIETVVAANRDLIATRVDQFFNTVIKFIKFVAKHHKTILNFAKGLGIAVLSIKALNAILVVTNALAAANPVGLIVIGVATLVAGIVLLVKNWDKITARFKGAPAELKPLTDFFQKFGEVVGQVVGFIGRKLPEIWERFKPLILRLIGAFNSLPGPIKAAILLITTGPLGGLILMVKALIDNWDTVGPVVKGAVKVAVAALKVLLEVMISIIEAAAKVSRGVGNVLHTVTGGRLGERTVTGEKLDPDRKATAPQLIPPTERIARSIQETRETSSATVTVAPAAGTTAALTGKPKGRIAVVLEPTGDF